MADQFDPDWMLDSYLMDTGMVCIIHKGPLTYALRLAREGYRYHRSFISLDVHQLMSMSH